MEKAAHLDIKQTHSVAARLIERSASLIGAYVSGIAPWLIGLLSPAAF